MATNKVASTRNPQSNDNDDENGPKDGNPVQDNYHGIDTRAIAVGSNEVYERKVAIMNQALIDLGMGPFQWKIFAMTGFGWFVDNVEAPR